MRLVAYLMVVASWAICVVAQDNSPKPKISKDALNAEQLAVYRVILSDYLRDSPGKLNLSNKTYPFELDDLFFDKGCVKGIKLEVTHNSVSVVHVLTSVISLPSNVVLVDPEQQSVKVDQNDPQNLLNKAIDGREPLTKDRLDKSVELAFATGLFSLSEIVFDKGHRHAVVSYSFWCGRLCGHGNVLLLEKRRKP